MSDNIFSNSDESLSLPIFSIRAAGSMQGSHSASALLSIPLPDLYEPRPPRLVISRARVQRITRVLTA